MSTELAIRDGQSTFDAKQLAALEQLGVAGASRADQAIFFHQCVRTGLDPFARQVYMIGRKTQENGKWITKQTIQTGIDGFRLIARRAADRRHETLGYTDDLWCGEDGIWREVWLSSDPPAAAKVTVLRNGQPFPAVAVFAEFRQTKSSGELTRMWHDKPAHMIQKCAEALALRKAFPQDLSGLYTEDETGIAPPDGPGEQQEAAGPRRMSRRPLAVAQEPVADAEPAGSEPTDEDLADMAAEMTPDAEPESDGLFGGE